MNVNDKKILLVDDHSVVRKGIYLLIKKHFTNVTVSDVSSLKEAISVVHSEPIEFIVLDIDFPEGNSLSFIEYILSTEKYNIKILIFTGLDESIYAFKYLKAGASGFLRKFCEEDEIVNALTKFFETGKYLSEDLKERLLDNMLRNHGESPTNILSLRELEVARLLAEGLSTNAISSKLNLQKSTVSTYKTRIFEKLGVENVPALINFLKTNQ
ncbi:Response regulator UvrY [Chryseobacterium aquaeductus]|uniref:Response regulator UvrY n=1 Tax=Chryseobacterium aquaeductus TaxID=2675056 RepID=A0A9N8MJ30_9FLAO|nr:response regulator transcription factor [Chryseobacterium aquaeductus]CAA7331701.1 Response regulator UvrY [Chryseobacterium potabilaquae]CAD7811785.1 Response regulator UvrY [Chryseobacterium aquaeductus]